jgi:hypothetical protein
MDGFIAEKQVDLGLKRDKSQRKFIRGPIPWDWWMIAANLPGKALHVASVLLFLQGVSKSNTFRLQPARFRECGISRRSVSAGLGHLRDAGLICIEHTKGAASTVTIHREKPTPQPVS